MYDIIVSPKAEKQLKIITKIHKLAIKDAVNELAQNPYLGKPLTRGLTGRYSYKIGVYRIIYKIKKKDKTVYIITAGHRRSVYK